MCFSATASFAGSAVITAVGIATLTKAKKPKQIPLAVIPLIFGIQQCAEGILWVTLKSGGQETLQHISAYTFLITALVIWPTMIPLATRLLEKDKGRKRILDILTGAGGVVSLFYVYCLLVYSVTPEIHLFHIYYGNDFPALPVEAALALYLAATILPLFVSSIKRMRLFGALVALSCLVTAIFFSVYLTSVWCFLAALISIVIYWVLHGMNKETETNRANLDRGDHTAPAGAMPRS